MRRPLATLALLALVVGGVASLYIGHGQGNAHARVMVLGVDGGSWNVILPMFEAGELPNLKGLFDHGIHGVLESRPPILSPVVWTTMFTGKLPEEHGVRNWKTSQSTHRKVKVLWNMTSEAGLATRVFNVPASWPPEAINGRMLSGFPLSGSTLGGNTGLVLSLREPSALSSPFRENLDAVRRAASGLAVGDWSPWFDAVVTRRPSVRGRMKVKRLSEDRYYLSPFYRVDEGLVISYPQDLAAAVSRSLGEAYIPEGPGWSKHAEEETPSYLYEHLVDISRIQTGGALLSVGEEWDLFIYVLTLVDRVSHPYWSYMQPSDYDGVDPLKAERYGEAVRNAYRESDRQIGELLAAAKGDFFVVVASDHGFKSSRKRDLRIGTHAFDGIYMVSGPGLSKQEGPRAYIEDVAPTILYLLGMPLASDMDGDMIATVLEARATTPATVVSYESEAREGSDLPVDDSTWEQLRGLGYVDGAPPRR
ncbi:MAG: alkaline phosphatase family protein [Candidatus Binatia bacterium]